MHISEFKQGDIITRVAPERDGSIKNIGNKMQFIGIANVLIYFNTKPGTHNTMNLDGNETGWDYWQEPPTFD